MTKGCPLLGSPPVARTRVPRRGAGYCSITLIRYFALSSPQFDRPVVPGEARAFTVKCLR